MNRYLSSIGLVCIIALFLITDSIYAQNSRPIVRIIYFLPANTRPQDDIDAKLDRLIKTVQKFYADEMERHGFDRKTFRFEADANGNAVVHHFKGKHPTTYYYAGRAARKMLDEIPERFDISKDIIFIFPELSGRGLGTPGSASLGNGNGGTAVTNQGATAAYRLTAHELGHTFGLGHDFRDTSNIMGRSTELYDTLSYCAAEMLDIHRAFNSHRPTTDKLATIEMDPPTLASPPNTIRFRFEITDPDGLHQVGWYIGGFGFHDCKRLNGTKSTIEFTTTLATSDTDAITLQLIDANGNISWNRFEIDITPLISPPEVVSIPDPHLAEAVRKALGLSAGTLITTHVMADLSHLYLSDQTRDLTGLEHARNLSELRLFNIPADISPLKNLTQLTTLWIINSDIPDISPLKNLIQLRSLDLSHCNISDISPLGGMTQMEGLKLLNNTISDLTPLTDMTQMIKLDLTRNNISDVSPLAEMTNLRQLYLTHNNISDVSSFSGMTDLRELNLRNNSVSDISSFVGMTELRILSLDRNQIEDISPLAGLTQLTNLSLNFNRISDILALTGMTRMWNLGLGGNTISDISVLARMKNLHYLKLHSNLISDISPLVGLKLTGLEWISGNPDWTKTVITLVGNPLSHTSINTHIPAMQAKDINVSFDDIAHPALYIISGDGQEDFAGKFLSSPIVVEVQDAEGDPIRNRSVTFTVIAGGGHLTNTTTTTDADGNAQTALKLGWTQGINAVRVTAERIESWAIATATVITPETQIMEDVNRDEIVDVEDLVLVAATLGTTHPDGAMPNTDINGDGIVNREDMELVMAALDAAPAAPAMEAQPGSLWTAANLQRWIDEARQITHKDATFQRGIAALEQLLRSLLPKETALLANYPNPFNPETWIPYHLSAPAEVTVRIYGVNGVLIRNLALGHQSAGIYEHRGRAVYWNGKNEQGERVASGIYFYTLTAGDFASTRKMLIRK